jgi:hypothetical protein
MGYEGQIQPGDNLASLPFAEINYGPLPNVQVATSFPLSIGATQTGSTRYSIGKLDLGVKVRFVQETATRPQVSFYPSIGVPTGIQSVEAQADEQTLFLPLWAQNDRATHDVRRRRLGA